MSLPGSIVEAYVEFSIAIAVLLVRLLWRYRQRHVRGQHWAGDDYFAILAIVFIGAGITIIELVRTRGALADVAEETVPKLTLDQRQKISEGSQILFAGYIVYTTVLWCLKGCMVCFYTRLTHNDAQRKLVRLAGAVCVLAYVVTLVVYFTHCLPLYRLWQVSPYPGEGCARNTPNYIALVVTNTSTDFMIMYIPLPILWAVKLPIRQKLILGVWLCSGFFIIFASIIRCVICLRGTDNLLEATIVWSVREILVGVFVVNLPVMKPMLGRFKNKVWPSTNSGSPKGRSYGDHRLSSMQPSAKRSGIERVTDLVITNSSQEQIIDPEPGHFERW
ncbi:hypothetical protein NX059_010911 [Plenodomus lindquistii]|nr:hypothetical protein NX059_010911 [Plenodomus lindquistii]